METVKSNKIGKFEIPVEIINESPQIVRAIMAECIVIGVGLLNCNGVCVYTAVSERFDEVPKGEKIPFYCWEISGDIDGGVLVSGGVSGCRRSIGSEDNILTKKKVLGEG